MRWLHPIHEIDDVLVGHADAAGRDGLPIYPAVGAVDAVQGVLVAPGKVDRAVRRADFRATGDALGVRAERADLRLGIQSAIQHTANRGDAGPG